MGGIRYPSGKDSVLGYYLPVSGKDSVSILENWERIGVKVGRIRCVAVIQSSFRM